jgi:hypothetical protein
MIEPAVGLSYELSLQLHEQIKEKHEELEHNLWAEMSTRDLPITKQKKYLP